MPKDAYVRKVPVGPVIDGLLEMAMCAGNLAKLLEAARKAGQLTEIVVPESAWTRLARAKGPGTPRVIRGCPDPERERSPKPPGPRRRKAGRSRAASGS